MHTEIVITGMLTTNTSFAVCVDTGEPVFVPSRVAVAADIEVGGTYKAILALNTPDQQEKSKWRCVKIDQANAALVEDVVEDEPVTTDEIFEEISGSGRTWSAHAVAGLFFDKANEAEIKEIEDLLEEMVARQDIAKATIFFGSLDQTIYAESVEVFTARSAVAI